MIKTWNSFTLSFKLIVLQSVILIITTAGLSWTMVGHFERSLADRTLNQLESVRALKKQRIQIALDRLIKTAQVAVEEVKVHRAYPHGLEQIFKRMPFQYEWLGVEWLSSDTALPKGAKCIYKPNAHETTPYFCEVEPVAQPLSSESPYSLLELWIIVQQPYRVGLKVRVSEVEEILQIRAGMGESGLSYLLNLEGPVDSPERAAAVQNQIDANGQGTYVNKKNQNVFYAHTPIARRDLRWILFSELEGAEALAPAQESKKAFGPAILIAMALAIWAAYGLSRKIIQSSQNAERRSWISGQDTERARLARELHDGVGQLLTWFSLKISASKLNPQEKVDLQTGLSGIQNELRSVVQNLSPLSLIDLGWIRSTEALCEEFELTTGKTVKLEIEPTLKEDQIQSFGKHQVFRILQECLNNVTKHSEANHVRISMDILKNNLKICVVDDGKGFGGKMLQRNSPEAQLKSLYQRVTLLRGLMQMSNTPEGGARIDFELPLEKL